MIPGASAPDAGTDPIAPRRVGSTLVDFSRLQLPAPVRHALAEAFWNHVGVRSVHCLRGYWQYLKTFARFVEETRSVHGLSDLSSLLVVRYVEWLNRRVAADGKPWHAVTRAGAYSTLRTLLRWLQRCRPHLLGPLDFPRCVFPGKNRNRRRVEPLSAQTLRTILKACEGEIAQLRARREAAERELALARTDPKGSVSALAAFVAHIDRHYHGILPQAIPFRRDSGYHMAAIAASLGGYRAIEPCLYPRLESLFAYYLAILIHTAGNPEAIAMLNTDCLQAVPMLGERELLVWSKGRAGRLQRRSFRTTQSFEPPALVREIIEWTKRLRPHARQADRNRLFLGKGHHGVAALSTVQVKKLKDRFVARHGLPLFALAAIRPTVLTAVYRASGDLLTIKEIANHQHLSTTIDYVRGPEAESHHRTRVAALQSAFLGHIERPPGPDGASKRPSGARCMPTGTAVSMFGFDCKDPFAGIAPGTHAGELCSHFLGCFTCPNAIVTPDPASLARLLKACEHLRSASAYVHPARYESIYAPQLKILEEDILTRFSAQELAAAAAFSAATPPLAELR
jgi:hypothetical protein